MTLRTPKRSRRIALLEGITAGILFGTAAVFIRLLRSLNVSSIAFWRLTIASAVLVSVILVSRKSFNFNLVKASIRRISILGIFLGLHFILFVSAVMDTTIINATVLVNTAPIFSVLISTFLFNVKPSRLALIGLVTSFMGVSLIAYADAFPSMLTIHLKGDLEAILAALAEGFYLNYGREIRGKLPLLPMMLPIYLVSAFTIGLTFPLMGSQIILPHQLNLILVIIALGFFPTALAHTFYFSSLSNLKSFETATLALLEPIGATILGIVLFNEIPNAVFVLGAFFVLSGIVWVTAKE